MQDLCSQDTGQMHGGSMTSEPLEAVTSPTSMFYAEDSLAQISAMLAKVQGSLASARAFGSSTHESSENSDQNTSSSKTSQLCAPAVLMSSRVKYPRSGMICGGIAYQLPPSAPLSKGTGFSSSRGDAWPTPTARDYKDSGPNTDYARLAARSNLAGVVGGAINPDWSETLMGFPIGWTRVGPTARNNSRNLGNPQGLKRLADLPKRGQIG